jgi:hypothetical protein
MGARCRSPAWGLRSDLLGVSGAGVTLEKFIELGCRYSEILNIATLFRLRAAGRCEHIVMTRWVIGSRAMPGEDGTRLPRNVPVDDTRTARDRTIKMRALWTPTTRTTSDG